MMMRQAKLSWDLWCDMKLRAPKKKVEEEIKEKLDRSASNGRRRCPCGTPEIPGKHEPSTLSRNIKLSSYIACVSTSAAAGS